MDSKVLTSDEIRKSVDTYLLNNPIDKTKVHKYEAAALATGTSEEYVRTRHRQLRRYKKIEDVVGNLTDKIADAVVEKIDESYRRFKQSDTEANLEFATKKRIRTKEDLIEVAEIDLTQWNIVSFECTNWEVGRKNKTVHLKWENGVSTGEVEDHGNIVTETLYRVQVKLSPRKLGNDLVLQKQAIIEELRGYSPITKSLNTYVGSDRNCLLEMCTFDLHLGSMSWGKESGENYDIKIAEKRFKDSVKELLSRVNLNYVERILFPLGNDFMNVDNKGNSTTNGTVVDTDVRFMKMLKVSKRIVIETIDELSLIAPVDVVMVPGNHDATVSLVLGEILDAWYHNNENVTIFGSPKTRKYYQYGSVGIQLTHGDEENHKDLGLIFATEEPDLWASTKYRFCQLGHFHKNKKTNYLSVDEHTGFQVQILPTLSSATAWAYKKGYHSLKQAKSFLYDREKGLIGEFTVTV